LSSDLIVDGLARNAGSRGDRIDTRGSVSRLREYVRSSLNDGFALADGPGWAWNLRTHFD